MVANSLSIIKFSFVWFRVYSHLGPHVPFYKFRVPKYFVYPEAPYSRSLQPLATSAHMPLGDSLGTLSSIFQIRTSDAFLHVAADMQRVGDRKGRVTDTFPNVFWIADIGL